MQKIGHRQVGERQHDLRPSRTRDLVAMTPEVHGTDFVAGRLRNGCRATAIVDEGHWADGGRSAHEKNLLAVSFSIKRQLARGKLTPSNVPAMDDTTWTTLEEPWDRLAWARVHWQKSIGVKATGKHAAEVFGYKTPEGYTAYEREPGSSKHSPITPEKAMQFGRKFKINWQWIMDGVGSPFDAPASGLTEPQARVVELMSNAPLAEQESIANVVEAALRLKVG